ncbi:hypothetical protein DRF60_20715 [Chryseobacterium elymi]|uniref:RHS repeat protein n=2 Tax=Chryseobacterium elymi TaxID=395936 RepID=A0A3D9CZD6_9FLAO|nr:hypothetical protein DRF60_20715 [Chryseobacterium elymi]
MSSNLGQYNPTEIDLFSGQPNINFNLFNFSKEGYNVDLNLAYNLASIKPDIPPGWNGAGWSLNVGGVVTRTVKGGVDEVYMNNITPHNKYSYYDNYSSLDATDWDSPSKMQQFIDNNRSIGGNERTVYPAPDEFNFNVNGMSGSFYKNHKGSWIIASGDFKDIKVEDELKTDFSLYEDGLHIVNNRTHIVKRIIYGFTLTDQKGIKYIFGKTPESIEFSATPNSTVVDSYNPNFVANSWFLTKVILPSGFEITYNYERENKAFYKVHSSFASLYTNINSGTVIKKNQGVSGNIERTFITYLKDIKINNIYSVDFFRSTANVEEYDYTKVNGNIWTGGFGYTHHYATDVRYAKHFSKLDRITVKQNSVVEEINFSYLEDPTKKLYLTGFNHNGKPYQFEYYSTDIPKYNLRKNDHWGYYNNKSFTESVATADGLYYSYDQLKNVLSSYKETDPLQLTKGVLKKVIYPTKGFSEYIYEAHDYNKVISVQTTSPVGFYIENTTKQTAGGLRIKRTITNPGDAQNIVKDYFYTDTGTAIGNSSGILSGKPIYFEEDQNSGARIYRFADMPIIPSNNTKGKHIVYSKVTEKVSETNAGGTIEYIFSNSDNGYLDIRPNTFMFTSFSSGNTTIYNNLRNLGYNSLEFERGEPLSITKKDQNGQIVYQTKFKYSDAPSRFDSNVRSYDFQSNVYGEPIINGPWTIMSGMAELIRLSAYNNYSYHPYLREKENVFYKNNAPVLSEITKYTYGSALHNQLTKQEFSASGNSTTTSYNYAHEKGNQLMLSKNMIGIPLETTTTKTINGATKTLSKTETLYPLNQSEANIKTSGLALPTSVLSYDLQNTTTPSTEVTYDKYDSKGNLQQYTAKNGISTTIIWGYNQTQPIAKIEGAKLSDISQSLIDNIVSASDNDAQLGTEASEQALISALDLFRNNSALSTYQITSYSYDPLIGVTSITPPSGIREVYVYDTANRLKEVKQLDKDAAGNPVYKIVKEYKYNYKN